MTAPLALVTGAAKRIGAVLAEHLARAGFDIALHANHSGAEAQALAARLRAHGGRCEVFTADLAQHEAPHALLEQIRARMGRVDLLVNNASLFRNDDLRGFRAEDLTAHMAVNLTAPLRLTEAMAAQTDLGAEALVVNMLDNKIFAQNPDFCTYTLSKSALATATETAAMRLQGRPRVCGIAPSITLASGAQTPEDFARTARINPLARRVYPDDLAAAVLYLWHEPRLDGQILAIDAGQRLWHLKRDVAFLAQEGPSHG